MRRFCSAKVPLALVMNAMRFQGGNDHGIKSHDPTFEDDRWLEAELEESQKHKTPEERYAAEKQRNVLAKMMNKMRSEHKEHVEKVTQAQAEKHTDDVAELKKMLEAVQAKLDNALKDK